MVIRPFPHILPVSVSPVSSFPPILPLFSPFPFAYTPSYVCLLTATAAIGVVSCCVVVVPFLLRILVVAGDIETLANKLSPRVQPFLRGTVKNLWYSTVFVGVDSWTLNVSFVVDSIICPIRRSTAIDYYFYYYSFII